MTELDEARECDGTTEKPRSPCGDRFEWRGFIHTCQRRNDNHVTDHKCRCGAKWGH